MIYSAFFRKRKLLWLINAIIFNLCRIIPFRKYNLWLFGAYGGLKYADNSKALFEYLYKYHKGEVHPVWLTYNKKELEAIRMAGYDAFLINTWKGKWISMRCGVAYFTHGIDDFGAVPLIGGALIVALWHGVGFKKIYGATYRGNKAFIMKMMNSIFSWTYRNMTCATSEYTRKQFYIRFATDKHNTYITGQPRNDIFKNVVLRQEVFVGVNIPDDKKIILYMPTYRWGKNGNSIMEEIVDALYSHRDLSILLEELNYVIVIKLHPVTRITYRRYSDKIYLLEDKNIRSNQKLLAIADCLITDYSSCFTDYALLNSPIIFYTPDHAAYLKNAGDMDAEYYSLCSINRTDTINGLIEMLKCMADGKLMRQTEAINELFEDISIRNTCYSENVYQLVKRKIETGKGKEYLI